MSKLAKSKVLGADEAAREQLWSRRLMADVSEPVKAWQWLPELQLTVRWNCLNKFEKE